MLWLSYSKTIEKDQQYVRNGSFFNLQKFLDSIVHILDTLHLRKTQTPAVADVIHSGIFSCRLRVLAVDTSRLKDKRQVINISLQKTNRQYGSGRGRVMKQVMH